MLNIVENGNHIILTNKTLYGFTNKSTEKCAPTNFGERASILRGILRRRDSTHEGFYARGILQSYIKLSQIIITDHYAILFLHINVTPTYP